MQFGGQWTTKKLEILRQYLDAYTTALKDQPFQLTYVDAFAGAGSWSPRAAPEARDEDYSDFLELRDGSPRIALEIEDRAFDRFVFIERNRSRSRVLNDLRVAFPSREIEILNEDANTAIPRICNDLQPSDRAVVFLDPFATQLDWSTVGAIAKTEKIDCWILFPIMAVVRMMPTGGQPDEAGANRLDRVFGGRDHWREIYRAAQQPSLFPDVGTGQERTRGGREIAARYKSRLESVFARVAPTSGTLTNSNGTPMFELFFAASNPVGAPIAIRIANHILTNW